MQLRQYAGGLLLIGLGVLFLLQTLGVTTGLSFWSVAGVLIGLAIAGDGLSRHRPDLFTVALGLWIAAMGAFSILSRSGVTTVTGGDVARHGWPVLIVALGLSMLVGQGASGPPGPKGHKGAYKKRVTAQMVGDLRYGREPWSLEDDIKLQTFVGDLKLDLTTAVIAPGPHRIEVSQVVGDAVVKVPDTVSVRARAESNIGEVRVLGESRSGVGYVHLEREEIVPGAHAEIIIDASVRVGSIRIEQVPASDFEVF